MTTFNNVCCLVMGRGHWQSCGGKTLDKVSTFSFKTMYKHLVKVEIVVDSGTCDSAALED